MRKVRPKVGIETELPPMDALVGDARRFYHRREIDYDALRSFVRHRYTNWDECWKTRARRVPHSQQIYDDLRRSTDDMLDGVLWGDWQFWRNPTGAF